MKRLIRSLDAALFVAMAATVSAQEHTAGTIVERSGSTPAERETSAASQDIRRLLVQLENNFNKGDAKGIAACWTDHGDFVGQSGDQVEGRDRIEKIFQDSLARHQHSTLRLHVLTLRVVNEKVALVDTLADVSPPEPTTAGEPDFNLVLVKDHDRWLVESARESIIPAPEQRGHLKELEWLVGDWTGETAAESGLSLSSTCGWTDNRSFLIRKFTVEGKKGVDQAGTEVIGWDPHAKRLRSWVFDSNGGFGENMWVKDGNRWLMQYSGTLADGSEASVTNVLTIVNGDTMTLDSKDRTANGERLPDIPAVTLKRKPANPESKAEALK